MALLVDSFNPAAAEGVMCRDTISVGWDGRWALRRRACPLLLCGCGACGRGGVLLSPGVHICERTQRLAGTRWLCLNCRLYRTALQAVRLRLQPAAGAGAHHARPAHRV